MTAPNPPHTRAQVAIEQLQAELTASRKEEQAIRDEAQRVCDDQAGELRRAEEQLQQMEAALMSRSQQAAGLTAKVAELEAELESTRHEQRTFGSVYAAKERDAARRLEALGDETAHQRDKAAEMERLLKERAAALAEQRERVRGLKGWWRCWRSAVADAALLCCGMHQHTPHQTPGSINQSITHPDRCRRSSRSATRPTRRAGSWGRASRSCWTTNRWAAACGWSKKSDNTHTRPDQPGTNAHRLYTHPPAHQHLEQRLGASEEEAAALRRQAADAAALAEQRAREKAAADKEWGRRLGGRDKELAGRVKDLEGKLQAADERGEVLMGVDFMSRCRRHRARVTHTHAHAHTPSSVTALNEQARRCPGC